jgi:hypothetical protein
MQHQYSFARISCPYTYLFGIPRELQDIVYRLLQNPILGQPACVSLKSHFGARQKYDLSPNILRVCSQTNAEVEISCRNNKPFT